MRRIIYVLAYCLGYLCSGAQDTVHKRLNISASYIIGFQTFGLSGLESHINERLIRNSPTQGRIENTAFPATLTNQFSIVGSVFRNKKWFLSLDIAWGKNNLTSYAYSSDSVGNPYIITANTRFKFLYTGYSISRNIELGKLGVISPFIGFYMNWQTPYNIDVSYQVNDKFTNEKKYSGKGVGGSGDSYKYGSPYLFWLFDNPKLGFYYNVKLFNHVYLNFSYSYWFANSYFNELYSLSNYLIKPRSNRTTTKNQTYHRDLYSHNISIGINLKLLE